MNPRPVTPRATRLLRVPTLRAGQDVVAALVAGLDPRRARDTAILVPGAAPPAQLRRTVERRLLRDGIAGGVFDQLGLSPPPPRPALCLPSLVSRAGFHALLHARLRGAPPAIDEVARETIVRAAVDEARASLPPPFTIRPGLLVEMLAFHDALIRLRRTVDDLERLLVGTLSGEAETDRGAARLLQQTLFLVAAYRAFERRLRLAPGIDEHGVRALAEQVEPEPALRHLIVAVADVVAEPGGLWPADYDLLTRLPGLERIDVIATDAMLSSGFDERLDLRLPGLTVHRVDTFAPPPILRVPEEAGDRRFFLCRDREEELHLAARELKQAVADPADATPADDHAIVVARPLPYLYLARHAFDAAGVPWTAADALPLASEPYAAVVDLVGEAVAAECARGPLAALLRSPHVRITTSSGRRVGEDDVVWLDRELERASYFGGFARLREVLAGREAEAIAAASGEGGRRAAWRAEVAAAVLAAVDALEPLSRPASHADHVSGLIGWLDRHHAPPPAGEAERPRRARAAVRQALRAMADASRSHHDPVVEFRDVIAWLHRWIEARTFQPRVGEAGVHLVDADAARFTDAAHVRVVGLVDGDWPQAGRREILYPAALLADLGWPRDAQRTAAARAQFADLLRLARDRVTVSSFTLEDDTIVEPSVLLEELEHVDLAVTRVPPATAARVSIEDALWYSPVDAAAVPPAARPWLALRQRRASLDPSRFQGTIGPFHRPAHAVTQIDTWLDCPFRYFAQHVLGLDDEREQEPGLTPRERGELVHAIFERFFGRWAAEHGGAVTVDALGGARRLFAEVVEAALERLAPADAAIERTRLLGSAVAAGMGDLVLQLEAERDVEVLDRRLEERLDGRYPFVDADGTVRDVEIRGKADRIDLLEGGRLALVDYKSGRAPGRRAVQLVVYAIAAEARLGGHLGRAWQAASADYVAFRGAPVSRALGRRPEDRATRMAEGQAALLTAVRGIDHGEFPPRPAEQRLCTWCPYDAVCRKDYVGEGEGEAEGGSDGPA